MAVGGGSPAVTFGVLGPLVAENAHGPVNLKGRRHRAVLARLLIAQGRVVPVGWLIDDLWDDAPEGALGAVQTFVGALRKALEPGRPPRTPARLLVTAPPGYALRTEPDAVDARRFEAAVTAAGELLDEGKAEDARALLDEALGLWRGPAYAEFAAEDWARAEADRLNELRLLGRLRRAEATLALGQAAEVVPELEAQVAGHPLREDGWRLLASALYASGRQGDALAALRRARDVLRTELGVDPGEGLRRLEADILAHAPHLTAPPRPIAQPASPPAVSGLLFVGRTAELDALAAAAAATVAAGRPVLVLLSGVAGAGKTALARTLTDRLAAAGWTTAWGASPELPGAPSAWPWTQLFPARPDSAPFGGEPAATRFHRHRAIGARLAIVAARGPVLLVFDDLHWADEETLALLTALAADPDAGPVLIVGSYRSTEISAELAEALGRAARTEPTRIYLGGLAEPQVGELFRAVAYRDPAAADTRLIHARSAGNPFFVRELARLWDAEGEAALRTVPAGVRDVLRHRLSGLPETARTHLRQAAVLGPEVGLDALIALAGDEDAVLDSVESALLAGFLVERDAERLEFAHALVHETLYDDIPHGRRARWHAAAAEILERDRPEDVEALAHQLLRAGARVDAARTAHYARAAARRAEERFAPHEAGRLWRETVAALDRSEILDAHVRLEATMGLVRALALTGDLGEARRQRAEATTAAEALGDPVRTAGVIGSFTVPAIWTTNDDEALSTRLVSAAERTLASLPSDRDAERAGLLITIAMERRADATGRARQAAEEAEGIARRLADPALIAAALNGRFLQTFHRAGLAPQRARIGAELLELAARHDGLVAFEVLGHLILVQARAALADFVAADQHIAAAERLAGQHGLPLVAAFSDWYAALRLAVAGRAHEARNAYRAAAGRHADTGMTGLTDGLLPLQLLCLDAFDSAPATVEDADWGPYAPWARGFDDEAGRGIPDSPRDLLFEARSCLHAIVAVKVGDRPAMERLYAELLPAADELAGAGSGLLVLGPTAQHLGNLAAALGRTDEAAAHCRQALAIAEAAGAPHWAIAARAAL